MTKDRQPWSVRGVSREARAAAAKAAARRRLTIGEWVTATILEAARREAASPADAGDAVPAHEPGSRSPGTSLAVTGDRGATPPALAGALGDLVRHLESNRTDERLGELLHRLERNEQMVGGRIEQMAAALYAVLQTVQTHNMPTAGDAESDDQRRLAEAVESLAAGETRRQDQMAAVAEALTMLARKVEADQGPAPAAQPAPDRDPAPEPPRPGLLARLRGR